MAFAAQTDALSALDTGRDFNQQRIGRSIRVPQGNLFFTARCRFLQADRNLSVQIEILCRTAAGDLTAGYEDDLVYRSLPNPRLLP